MGTIRIYTVPKSGTHFIKGVLAALNVDHEISHCFSNSHECNVDLEQKSGILIRDPRALFVSLMRWSDRRCSEGLRDNKTFPSYQNAELFRPWLDKSTSQKLEMLLTLNPESPFSVRHIADNFSFVTENIDNPNLKFVRFEDIIGSRGGGSEARQLKSIRCLLSFFDNSATDDEIKRAAVSAWGSSTTFHKGQIGGWKGEFDARSYSIFLERWGRYLDAWGYDK